MGQERAVIKRFAGKHAFLSNFHPSPIGPARPWLVNFVYPTVEHAFQAAKTLDPSEQRLIATAPTPLQAKRLGRVCELRPDWERVKLDVMFDLVLRKFEQNAELRAQLLATGDAELIEGNTWGDRYWGQVNGKGENHLGRILMEVRAELTDDQRDELGG